MRVAIAVASALALGACGGAGTVPAGPEATAAPVELGETVSSVACALDKATYAEPQKGWEVRFRAGQPWELTGMTESVFDLVSPEGEVLWGAIASNMGTSRDVGAVFQGCARPGPDDAPLSEAQIVECQVWSNLVYSLNGGEPGFMPGGEGAAPERILMTDLGRKIRYAVAESPGDEPWDVFTFKACAE